MFSRQYEDSIHFPIVEEFSSSESMRILILCTSLVHYYYLRLLDSFPLNQTELSFHKKRIIINISAHNIWCRVQQPSESLSQTDTVFDCFLYFAIFDLNLENIETVRSCENSSRKKEIIDRNSHARTSAQFHHHRLFVLFLFATFSLNKLK